MLRESMDIPEEYMSGACSSQSATLSILPVIFMITPRLNFFLGLQKTNQSWIDAS
jgi:hypothetical protein